MKKHSISYSNIFEILMLVMAVIMYAVSFILTKHDHMAHDVGGHISYINKVLKGNLWPNPEECWQCYQPPLFYWIGAIVSYIGGMTNNAVRLMIFAFFMIYIFYGRKFLKNNITSRFLYLLCLGIFLFLPHNSVKASTINNDIPVFALGIAAIYYLDKWWKLNKPSYFGWAVFLAALAMLFKTSALVPLACVIIVGALGIKKKIPVTRKVILVCVLSVLIGFIPLAKSAHYKFIEKHSEPLLIYNVKGLPDNIKLKNEWLYFTIINPHFYLGSPFINTYDDKTGRQYLWNLLVKTAIYDEFAWHSERFAVYLNYITLALIFICVPSALLWGRKYQTEQNIPVFVTIGLSLAAMIMLRYLFPYGSSINFRYIGFSVPVFILLYAKVIESQKKYNWHLLSYITYILGMCFLALCFLVMYLQLNHIFHIKYYRAPF